MYEAYFLNINTGEIKRIGNPRDNLSPFFYPAFNVNGWSQVGYEMYQILLKVQNFGLCRGLEGWESIED